MTLVIPAWYIIHVLENIPEIVAMRDEKDAKREGRPKERRPTSEKTSGSDGDDSNPNHH